MKESRKLGALSHGNINGNGNGAERIQKNGGLTLKRVFTQKDVHPFDEITWEKRSASISNEHGQIFFEQKDVEVPSFWSQTATNIVVQKYFKGQINTPQRESSVKQLITRVAATIAGWGKAQGYFASSEDAEIFEMELTHLLVFQKLAFNSPVWFNVGIEKKPQCSACFINSVQDTMESILNLAKTEGMLFKWGSGTGSNLSPIRSSREQLSGGGIASGPVSFMKGFDSFAGVIKSGGKTRRAAKMVILNSDHPDIVDFIKSKSDEEKKAWALIDSGYDGNFNVKGGAYDSVQFQNANHSVRVTDEFMKAVLEDKEYQTKAIVDGRPMDTYKARELLKMISESTHICGDPGMQFDTTINDWHTCPNTARINASNPCSEYMFLDDSACNLASLNLMKFRTTEGEFNVDTFSFAAHISILAQEIIVDNASYPTPAIERNSHDYRPLGLGYANLGALLMARGIPYDSEEGRATTSIITAIMHGQAYKTSSLIAMHVGPFKGYSKNAQAMLGVIKKHASAVENINPSLIASYLLEKARAIWQDTYAIGSEYGYRNSQVTVLAPTGTIGFMMDCDTTGIEPDIALVKYKKLVGGGLIKIVNQTVPEALKRLGYSESDITEIVAFIDKNDTIEGAPHLAENHLNVFDCAFKAMKGKRSIHYMGHIRMMAAVQPFISGAISKTVNLPNEASVDEIMEAYIQSWKLGLKAVAIYRDGSKRTQPLSTSINDGKKQEAKAKPNRRRLLDERQAITHKFTVAGHEGYITAGLYEDGTPGEIFVTMAKEGSVISGLMDSFSTSISLALQYGVPLKVLTDKFAHQRFEPSGITNHPQIRFAKSIIDYIFRWLALKFLPASDKPQVEEILRSTENSQNSAQKEELNKFEKTEKRTFEVQADAPPCHACGEIMVRNGACYKCLNCGETSGCS